jgi:hypothetical protein
MIKDHGRNEGETLITDEIVETMTGEADAGYDVDEILQRRGGRRAMGAAPASMESVRLDAELKRRSILRAAEEHKQISVRSPTPRRLGRTPVDLSVGGGCLSQRCVSE